MGKSTGSVRAQASRVGLTLQKLSSKSQMANGGQYKYAIRGGRTNMRAGNLSEASSLIRSASGGRTRGNFKVGDTIAPASRGGGVAREFASRVVSVTRQGYTVSGGQFIPRRSARRVVG